MYFQLRGKRIQCMRSRYKQDHETKDGDTVSRSVPELVVSFKFDRDNPSLEIPSEVECLLSDGEMLKLRRYLKNHVDGVKEKRAKDEFQSAADSLQGIADALEFDSVKSNMTADDAKKIYSQISSIERKMKRLGYKKVEILKS